MDAALRRFPDFDFEEALPRREAIPHPHELAKVMQLRPQHPQPEAHRRERFRAVTANDITSALSLVHEAATSIREAEGRVRDNESRSQALLQRATEELRSAEARAQAAEARAQAAEARAEEAENWLRQIFATISEELPPRR